MTELNRATIMGTGTMGPGMGAVLARAGLQVTLFDVAPEALERARGMVDVVRGVLDRLEVPDQGGTVSLQSDRDAALDGTEILIEAVPEQADLKRRLFAEVEERIAPDAIIASNTSGIPVTALAEGLAHPERVVGWHWSNPPHLIPMNEVIPGERTSPEVTAAIQGLTRRIGYHPVTLRKEVPGFVENRVLYAIMRECLALVDEGVIDVEGLDLCVKWGIGYKLAVVPPIQLLDMAGLDIYTSVAGYLNASLSNETGVSSTATGLKDDGKLGIKSGAGFFEYTPDRTKELAQQRAGALVAVRKALS
ncbi:MAG: 3-hydroxyacyl-CoA dehydrogenase NAD-binding domain-containing protein [Solirubrobacteraceae bacterium]